MFPVYMNWCIIYNNNKLFLFLIKYACWNTWFLIKTFYRCNLYHFIAIFYSRPMQCLFIFAFFYFSGPTTTKRESTHTKSDSKKCFKLKIVLKMWAQIWPVDQLTVLNFVLSPHTQSIFKSTIGQYSQEHWIFLFLKKVLLFNSAELDCSKRLKSVCYSFINYS